MAGRGERDEKAQKRQFLVHIDPDLKRRVKLLAVERDATVSSIGQEALESYLAAAGGRQKPADAG